ncbi:Flp family type IVb pilin [Nguyenibacter sp. L1]|uniref:Flp family type IVb pilin n=1 Tax=Nguyenibacter sp. L1 TaxID=3049350 RepID=UPI002B49035B|nr:Flp family type IVb pilin [Nguyenibacter sp. L1]WRH88024.1 Flp family type IVb pilin [Nguyenibacter sp. L1]
MMQYLQTLLSLKHDRRGVTMLEYGLIAALVAVVAIGALTTLGTNLSGVFSAISNKVTS